MIDLAACTQNEVFGFARMIYAAYNDRAGSLEEMAQHIVHEIFGEFHDESGEPSFALLRIFRVSRYEELPDDLKAQIPDQSGRFLTLMATVGLEADWCDRHTSKHHQVQPMTGLQSPLMQAVLDQIGMKADGTGVGISMFNSAPSGDKLGYFYVPNALDSPHFNDKDEFVIPYGVYSAVAVGSPFRSGASGILLGFSRVAIPLEQSCHFANMGVYLFTLLSQHDEKRVWA